MPPQIENNTPSLQPAPRGHVYLLILTFLLLLTGVFGVWYFSHPLPDEDMGSVAVTEQFTGWKTYENSKSGFEFKYPATWTDVGRDISIKNYFTKLPNIDVLDIDILKSGGSAQQVANKEISANNCPTTDKVLEHSNQKAMYVLGCSSASESYVFIYNISPGTFIRFNYHDDFDDAWSQDQKLEKFKQILSTFKSTSTSTPVNIQTITIHAGFDVTIPHQDSPNKLEVAHGHYLFWSNRTNTLIYDGKQIYFAKYNTTGNILYTALSKNGLHYAYVITPNDTKIDTVDSLYIDGKFITSDSNMFELAITDDGQHYFYSNGTASGHFGNTLKKDGTVIFTGKPGSSVEGFLINNDGSQYFLGESTSGNSEWVDVLNGQQIYKETSSMLRLYSFSDNFKHYGYIDGDGKNPQGNWNIFIDGKLIKTEVGSNVVLAGLNVTDSGHYSFIDENGDNAWVDRTYHPYTEGDGTGHGVITNEDGTHYLIEDGAKKKWNLDGKDIELDSVGKLELVGNTLYVYRVVQ